MPFRVPKLKPAPMDCSELRHQTSPLHTHSDIPSLENWASLLALNTINILMTPHLDLQPGLQTLVSLFPPPTTREYLSKDQRRRR